MKQLGMPFSPYGLGTDEQTIEHDAVMQTTTYGPR